MFTFPLFAWSNFSVPLLGIFPSSPPIFLDSKLGTLRQAQCIAGDWGFYAPCLYNLVLDFVNNS
ncbi:MAG: hypothetical protein HEQ35_20725 [Gloeotrichia echinulata IR180]|nr:hypothetical protein [Gloeotrichia echinulata DEX184]